MPESFDAYQYLLHLRSRWRVVATACAVALALALAVSLLATKQYVATARVLIEPPGSSDPRAATAISPVYLESLETYVHLALSDSLFAKAVNELGIRDSDRPEPLSSLKKSILAVEIPRNTKILDISVKLPDPEKAQELAAFIAQETVSLNQRTIAESDKAQTVPIEELRAEARRRVEEAEAASMEVAKGGSAEGLLEEMLASIDSRWLIQQEIFYAEDRRAELAGAQLAGTQLDHAGTQPSSDKEAAAESLVAAEARLARLRSQSAELDREIAAKRRTLASTETRQEAGESERSTAWAALQEAEARLAQAQATVAVRGERLQVIDPGVVPERHTSPNVPLNLIVALLFGAIGSLVYITIEFSLLLRKAESRRQSIRVAGHG